MIRALGWIQPPRLSPKRLPEGSPIGSRMGSQMGPRSDPIPGPKWDPNWIPFGTRMGSRLDPIRVRSGIPIGVQIWLRPGPGLEQGSQIWCHVYDLRPAGPLVCDDPRAEEEDRRYTVSELKNGDGTAPRVVVQSQDLPGLGPMDIGYVQCILNTSNVSSVY